MNRIVSATAFPAVFAIGLLTVAWVGVGFAGVNALALVMTAVIAAVYLLGAFELRQFRAATASLSAALADVPQPLTDTGAWLARVPAALQNPVRLRIEGERVALPGPALTPYLVGLLVMLGMLGTFLGMIVTFKGAVFALEGSTDLQAIRSALAAPIKGLGLSFGTSVAGVAASAMLGLLSALSRRERQETARRLDSLVATAFRPFSLGHQRQQAFKALEVQAQTLPQVVDRLQAMMEGLERRSQQLDAQLLARQDQFHRDVGVAYTGLADSVGASLKDSLTAGARAAGESIKPVVEAAMAQIAGESQRLHQRVFDATQTQLDGLSAAFGTTARGVSDGWTTALQTHADASANQVERLDRALLAFNQHFEQRSAALLASVGEAAAAAQSAQAASDQQRLQGWTGTLEAMAATLKNDWRDAGAQTLAQQQAVWATLEQTIADITERTGQQAGRTLDDTARLLAQSEELIRSRIAAEAGWVQQHGNHMDQLAELWRSELGALRSEEAARGQAAVDRLAELQAALADHLATLGTALEAPMTRLMQTAAEVPQAAAGVITQLREEMARLGERDNLALEEHAVLVERIGTLLQTLNQASGEQRTAIESLVASAATVLDQAGSRFAATLEAQAGAASEVATQVGGSAIELTALGEAFHHGVTLFSSSNEKLMDGLQRMESALGQSAARSDEQLAYYVAQAREVIDLSMSSQQQIVEDLRRLRSSPVAVAEGSAE